MKAAESECDTWPWTEADVRRIHAATRERARRFHAHLDSCSQCREQPFNLCFMGHSLLTAEFPIMPPLAASAQRMPE